MDFDHLLVRGQIMKFDISITLVENELRFKNSIIILENCKNKFTILRLLSFILFYLFFFFLKMILVYPKLFSSMKEQSFMAICMLRYRFNFLQINTVSSCYLKH